MAYSSTIRGVIKRFFQTCTTNVVAESWTSVHSKGPKQRNRCYTAIKSNSRNNFDERKFFTPNFFPSPSMETKCIYKLIIFISVKNYKFSMIFHKMSRLWGLSGLRLSWKITDITRRWEREHFFTIVSSSFEWYQSLLK